MADRADNLTPDEIHRIEEKLDRLLDLAPIIESLGRILVRRKTATQRAGLHSNTISNNSKIDKFEAVGGRRTFIELGEISVVKKRPKRKGTPKNRR